MCIRHFVTILACCCLLALSAPGCAAMDRLADGVGAAGKGAHDAAQNPELPLTVDMRTVLEGVGLAAGGLAALYSKIRYGRLRDTTRAIVRGVDDVPIDQAQPVKDRIAKRMERTGRFETLNAEVDRLLKLKVV